MVPPPPAMSTPPPVKRSWRFGQPRSFESQQPPGAKFICKHISCSIVIEAIPTLGSRSSNGFPSSSQEPPQKNPTSTPLFSPFVTSHETSSTAMPNNPPTSSILVPELTSPTPQPTPTPSSSVDWRLPFNYPSLISSSQSFSDSPPSLTVTPASPGSRAASTNTGAIAGGVIGGVALLALLAASVFILIRHRRKSRPPPSAEFMHLARGASELGFATMDGKTSPTLHRLIPLARQSSLEDEPEERPLEFVPEGYRDPVLEKAQESAAMREKYSRSEEGGYQ